MKQLVSGIKWLAVSLSLGGIAPGAEPASAQTNDVVRIVEARGVVEFQPFGITNWYQTTSTNQELHPFDFVRTRANGSVTLQINNTLVRFPELSEVQILPSTAADGQELRLIQGLLSFFHRDKPGRIRVLTSGGMAGVKGTEFVLAVATNNGVEQTTLSVIDGEVQFSNAGAVETYTNGQQAVSAPGRPPHLIAGFNAINLLQWCFYYPGVLDLDELPLAAAETNDLAASLAAYRAGDVVAALSHYPTARQPHSDAESVYLAALWLSAGQVGPAETNLSALAETAADGRNRRLANALRTLIAAVKRDSHRRAVNEQLSTELLAASYYEQSLAGPNSLDRALALARRAATNSPNFGFAWERMAELEFSFGQIDRARADLDRALQLSPRNAQGLALRGFLLAAQNRIRDAIASFNKALAVDSALGNAWLGRGLCRIRRGESKAGREDLLIAAAMEPQRATLRSYLGKALGDAGDTLRALHELNLAKRLDPQDPTTWLYSALLAEDNNRINEAIQDLQQSQELNDNRSVYRSSLLLDQDRAVRSANLARIYQEAGMDEVAVREATRAVDEDYADYSAHMFLANSYNALRDPNQIDLRYETPTYVEYLIGNLLAPVNAGVLSPAISQQEYSRLFERDQFGVLSASEYLSRGAWTESGAQYGTMDNSSYDFEAYYRSDPGQRPNNDVEQRQLSLTLKQQMTPHDSLFGMVSQYDGSGGDLRQYYYQTNADLGLRTRETQDPLLALGWNHEWEPGSHTLLLVGRLQDTYRVEDTQSPVQSFSQLVEDGPFRGVGGTTADQNYRSDTIIYTAEMQQVWQRNDNTLVGGWRFQDGSIDTVNLLSQPQHFYFFPGPPYELDQAFDERFERLSAYGYDVWRVLDSVQLTAGLSYDWLTYPEDFRFSPISGGRQTEAQVSPKGGVVWTPFQNTLLRAAYTRSLGGASLEQSFQLEPSQVAGFNQLFRSLIPESVEGENAGARFETWNVALEQKIGRRTYFALTGQLLGSKVDRQSGVTIVGPSTFASTTPEHLDFAERDLQATLDQLLGNNWTVGVRYQLTDARLQDQYTQIPSSLLPVQDTTGLLHQLEAHAQFNHSSGAFAQFEALWNDQHNAGYTIPEPGDEFWQFNVFVGYRSPRKHAELTLGVLNVGGHDYQLNPLNSINELPRSRTLVVRFKFDF